MKSKLSLFVFLLFTSYGISQSVNSEEIFRYINLGFYGRIELGDNMTKFKSLIEIKENRYYLKENIFGGSNSIELVQNKNNCISEIIFDYGPKIKLASKIAEYTNLGKPKMINGAAIWYDGKTEFKVYKQNGKVHSRLKDRNDK